MEFLYYVTAYIILYPPKIRDDGDDDGGGGDRLIIIPLVLMVAGEIITIGINGSDNFKLTH